MRRKIINTLYASKNLRCILFLFHRIFGKFKVLGKKGNKVDIADAILYHSTVCFRGGENSITVKCGETWIENTVIEIRGNDNCIFFGSESFVNGLHLIVEGDHNRICFGDDFFVMGDTRVYVVDGTRFEVGKGCMFSDRIEIRTTDNHSIMDSSGNRINYEEDVILEDSVWIGTGVTILKGVHIASGCIVGGASVVTRKHCVPNCVIAGNPAKEIRKDVFWCMERRLRRQEGC